MSDNNTTRKVGAPNRNKSTGTSSCPLCGKRYKGYRRPTHIRECHEKIIQRAESTVSVGAAHSLHEWAQSDYFSESRKTEMLNRAFITLSTIFKTQLSSPGVSGADGLMSQEDSGHELIGEESFSVYGSLPQTHTHTQRLVTTKTLPPHTPFPPVQLEDDIEDPDTPGSPLLADDIISRYSYISDCVICQGPVISNPYVFCGEAHHAVHTECAFNYVSRRIYDIFRPDEATAIECGDYCYQLINGQPGRSAIDYYSEYLPNLVIACPTCRKPADPEASMAFWSICLNNGMKYPTDLDWSKPSTPPSTPPLEDAGDYDTPSIILLKSDHDDDPDFILTQDDVFSSSSDSIGVDIVFQTPNTKAPSIIEYD